MSNSDQQPNVNNLFSSFPQPNQAGIADAVYELLQKSQQTPPPVSPLGPQINHLHLRSALTQCNTLAYSVNLFLSQAISQELGETNEEAIGLSQDSEADSVADSDRWQLAAASQLKASRVKVLQDIQEAATEHGGYCRSDLAQAVDEQQFKDDLFSSRHIDLERFGIIFTASTLQVVTAIDCVNPLEDKPVLDLIRQFPFNSAGAAEDEKRTSDGEWLFLDDFELWVSYPVVQSAFQLIQNYKKETSQAAYFLAFICEALLHRHPAHFRFQATKEYLDGILGTEPEES